MALRGGVGNGRMSPMDETYWQKRAKQAHVIAETLNSDTPSTSFTKCEMLVIAATYRRLAKRARKQAPKQGHMVPDFTPC
jgi:hypothetical protein